MGQQCDNQLGRTIGRKGAEKQRHGARERVVEKLVEVRWNDNQLGQMEMRGGGATRGGGAGRCKVAKGREAKVEHTAGGAQSAMAPPWFCDELEAGDRSRNHLFFHPNVGM